MAKSVTRRTFLSATVTILSTVACSEIAPPPDKRPQAVLPTSTPQPLSAAPPDGYIAVAPRVMRSGQAETISLALMNGEQPARSSVTVELLSADRVVAAQTEMVAGRGSITLAVPQLDSGNYELQVRSEQFNDRAPIRVENGTVVFVETDKPIYKPGQTLHIRVLALDPLLRPTRGEAIVEVMDAKGIKVFKQMVVVDEWGMADVTVPLSTEPNLGTWQVQASVGDHMSRVDARVERYVLPKYEITVEPAKSWALANETIRGTIASEYSFGKPVGGEVEIVGMRYVGTWEEYTRVTQPLDGKRAFELPPVQYVAGSPEGGGLGNVRLDVTVREQATGYAESTSQLITIAPSPVSLRIIPESMTFKPELPMSLLVVSETPDQQPVDTDVQLQLTYQDEQFTMLKQDTQQVSTKNGMGIVKVTPPQGAVTLIVTSAAANAYAPQLTLRAGYSPSGTFIHVEQVTQGALNVGDTAQFKVSATREAKTFFYEILSRGMVVYSDVADSADIAVNLTPLMTPEARLLVYQVLPTGEVVADYLPFKVTGNYPHNVEVSFTQDEARPGDELAIDVQTEGAARVGLAAVDRSVFILAENRLNLQQVFDELERLYMEPQAELHESGGFDPFSPIITPGAKETFHDAGVLVLTNREVPAGKQLESPMMVAPAAAAGADAGAAGTGAVAAVEQNAAASTAGDQAKSSELAEVQRVRQFFPETWLWTTLTTDGTGKATERVTAPDSITTWMLRGVALSKEKGLGIAEAQLRVFQPFFVQVDLPYSAIRGEEFPAKLALYNYQPTDQQFTVELAAADWFDLLDSASKTVTVAPNSVGAAEFMIRPTALGVNTLDVTARSQAAADAIKKELIVEPEGVARESVTNLMLASGATRSVDWSVPPDAIPGSPRAFVTLTGNMLSQTIDGLESLLQMPFGCGEQNMILFAPNVFVTRYLKETGQEKPEIRAKAEKLMLTGYQRQLTYRRDDSSFSAFGQSDPVGSLWLTAFVLKTFAQARDLMFIDDTVLSTAQGWIGSHQSADGSFLPVGFVHHQELLGGLKGTTALTAFIAIALAEAGDAATAGRAVRYLEGQLDQTNDAYVLAITTYALALAKSGRAQAAVDKLLKLAQESDEGLSWGDNSGAVQPMPESAPLAPTDLLPPTDHSAAIETTAYATLALLQHGDRINASRAVRWLASRRNAYGGFGSTQDTVVALQALTTAAINSRADIDATIRLMAGDWRNEVRITPANADVLHIVEVPAGANVTIETQGKGEVMAQSVQRYNVASAESAERSVFQIDVRYDADQVAVNDIITINADITFTPPMLPTPQPGRPVNAGMVVLDIAVPTGFAPVSDSINALMAQQPKLKRWDLAGRKVIFYIEDMRPNEQLTLTFQAQALYPVRAQAVTSQAYAYYRPEWKGEHLGRQIVVAGG